MVALAPRQAVVSCTRPPPSSHCSRGYVNVCRCPCHVDAQEERSLRQSGYRRKEPCGRQEIGTRKIPRPPSDAKLLVCAGSKRQSCCGVNGRLAAVGGREADRDRREGSPPGQEASPRRSHQEYTGGDSQAREYQLVCRGKSRCRQAQLNPRQAHAMMP